MQKHPIRNLILKTEIEIMHLSPKDPLMSRGRKFLQKIPSHKIDSLLEKSSDETLSSLTAFFGFLLKREDIPLPEKDKIRTFVKTGKLEKGERERKLLYKKIEMQQSIIKGLYQTLKTTKERLHKEIDAQKETIQTTQQAVKNCKLIILFLSALNCVESTAQLGISTIKANAVKVRTMSKAMVSAAIVFWTGCSICKKEK